MNQSSTEKSTNLHKETQIQLSKEQLQLIVKASKSDLLNYCEFIDSSFHVSRYHEVISNVLSGVMEKLDAGLPARVIISIPPRHGKTKFVSTYWPTYVLGNRPQTKFILSTYGADLSEKIGGEARDVLSQNERYRLMFPDVTVRQDTRSKTNWSTGKGGQYYGVGVGGPVTGIGADIILIDDPHKSRQEAESPTYRNAVYEYYRSTLYSRKEGAGAIIIIMQRWHTDDLVARVLAEAEEKKARGEEYDEWEVVNFPAIAEEDEYYNGNLFRKEGEALWPEKYPLDVLSGIRGGVGSYNWVSQYQQNPVHTETQVFKEDMFKCWEQKDIENRYFEYYTIVDPAISQSKNADNTVITTVAKDPMGPNIYRIREDAGHFTPGQTIDLVFKHYSEYKGKIFVETVQYQKALKHFIEEEQKRRGVYFKIEELKTNNKEVRIQGLLPYYERGVIFHRPGGLDNEYETELLHFPRGKHDDRIDVMSYLPQVMESTKLRKKVKQFIPSIWSRVSSRRR